LSDSVGIQCSRGSKPSANDNNDDDVTSVIQVWFDCTGVLDDVQKYYNINNKQASLLSTAFIISYMLLSPIFGYLGDRCNRTMIMSCGIIGWSAITFASSFVNSQVCMFGYYVLH